MQISRPPVSNAHLTHADLAHSASVSSDRGIGVPARVNLKGRVTPRTDDNLQRLRAHGSPTQRSLASSACDALSKDLFIANPARDKPVVQFGVSITLDEKKGILLANFMPHDDKLELQALAFRAERFFETEAGGIEMVVLEHAQKLPLAKATERSTGPVVTPKVPELKERPKGDIAAEQKALKKDIERFDNQSMQRKMASKLADMRINDGRSSSRLTALPVAHATVAEARLRKLATTAGTRMLQMTKAPFKNSLDKRDELTHQKRSEELLNAPVAPARATPRGLQYQFSKQEFADFHEEQWLASDHDEINREDVSQTSPPSSSEVSADTLEADFTGRPGRRNGLLDDNISAQLQGRLDQDLLHSSNRVEPGRSNRDGQVLSNRDVPDRSNRDGLVLSNRDVPGRSNRDGQVLSNRDVPGRSNRDGQVLSNRDVPDRSNRDGLVLSNRDVPGRANSDEQ